MLLDEIVGEQVHKLESGDMLVVAKGQWHRFDTPDGVKVMSVTPLPTDHSVSRPQSEH